MAAALLLAVSWVMTYLLIGDTLGSVLVILLATAAIMGMGSRLRPEAGILALSAVLLGALMRTVGLGPILIPALGAGLGVGLLWNLTRTWRAGSSANPFEGPPLAGTA